ncbi:protein involved in polysaccharide export, contains SLBB domain of the beta-grasp fold [Ekhidna lutea]|uniref:Protein involved in polysaccharide export, contains SLBB domain of the beta-grasp fold n=1 Tax=Ekhidna lutea TaxID=447679 RepID=A0A239FGV8_EKHLU|nr:SLBB domain-containing protein [Ekhidna lutea]SNS55991.1 protein involved in polysaccharide export, contains SLBB domain of the beta-grasp fold [Ekhidna lutea]
MYTFIKRIIFITTLIAGFVSNAQDINDLRSIDIDDLSDKQVQSFINRAESSGMTMQQLELLAQQRGMSSIQISKLRNRIAKIQSEESGDAGLSGNSIRLRDNNIDKTRVNFFDDLVMTDSLENKGLPIFGSEIFESSLTFEPSPNVATPKNYVLGAGDEIIIDIYGASEITYQQTISPDGNILISGVGPISLSGLTVEEAKNRTFNQLSSIYSGLKGRNPNTFFQFSVGKIRTINVNVVGNVKRPGTYALSSFSSAFNALYYAGGPNEKGSMRNIEVIRDNEKIATLDIYKYFFFGQSNGNPQLRDEDILVVRPYQNRIKFAGNVKQPAIYELLDNESIEDLLRVSGGVTPEGKKDYLNVFRKAGGRKTVKTVIKDQYDNSVLVGGDSIYVSPIPSYYIDRVKVEGAVHYPGYYELSDSLTLRQLLTVVEISRNAFKERGNIIRLNNDLSFSNLTFNLNDVLAGNVDYELKQDDLIRIASIFDVEEQKNVTILGEVKNGGQYPYVNGMTVEDLVTVSGGLKSSANTTSVEVARRVSKDSKEFRTAFLFDFSIAQNLGTDTSASSFVLEPFDVVTIKATALFRTQKTIKIEGEVMKPGFYALETEEDKITDLIARAGGLTKYAYPKGASLIRDLSIDDDVTTETSIGNAYRRQQLEGLIKRDSLDEIGEEYVDREGVGIELDKALNDPKSKHNIILQDGDVISVPKQLQTVRVRGEVLYPTRVKYDRSTSFKEYISLSGGFSDKAKKSKSYVVYPNGRARRTKTFLWLKLYPLVEPGSDIFIPQQEVKQKLSVQEVLGITSSLATIALIIDRLTN